MLILKEKKYGKKVPSGNKFILGVDVGATNCNFGIFKKNELLLSLHYKSERVISFTELVHCALDHLYRKHKIKCVSICIAAAGPRKGNVIAMTNRPWSVDATAIKRKTGLKKVSLINDFEAIAYGIDVIDHRKMKQIKKGNAVKGAPRVLLGAGTGLGKGVLVYDDLCKCYKSIASEGGHGDYVALGDEEKKLVEFIKKKEKHDIIEWEDVLSGRGLVNIFLFMEKKYHKSKHSKLIDRNANNICNYKYKDKIASRTFRLFVKIYARCAKNFALDVLAQGGVYIAGGIAANHSSIFKRYGFKDEFVKSRKQEKLLHDIPAFVITDYDISLYGAAYCAQRK
jgi:glucokinase